MTKRKYIKPPRSEDCVWRSGPPPEIGWWPADWGKPPRPECLRWWDGVSFSFGAPAVFTTEEAEICAIVRFRDVDGRVVWTDRWWEGQ